MMKQRRAALPGRPAERGTCPTCGGEYAITSKGVLRRHSGSEKCASEFQLPSEVIPAIRLIASLE